MTPVVLRRLEAADAADFAQLRLEGARAAPNSFRFDADDDFAHSIDLVEDRLARAHVLGLFDRARLIAIGGIEPASGARLRHKWLLWGMYVARSGEGLGERMVRGLLAIARDGGGHSVQLTLMSDNIRARALYERCGFSVYGEEPQSVLRDDGLADELLMRLVFAREPSL